MGTVILALELVDTFVFWFLLWVATSAGLLLTLSEKVKILGFSKSRLCDC